MYTNTDLKIILIYSCSIENNTLKFSFLILQILELFTRKCCSFLEK